ncbi:hypothetical protein JHK84_041087 [Glycine max]|uniref:Photosystem I assembly protein Ycf4 n=1 Tax=Glycine max TaxID=3847 RepID=A0A0R0GPT7_SOYBN|nr:hypothetical protein JHK85_041480 [Glycine max]KAG5122747.1 hypothetical protein JHK84_041087 [Glycine max]KAH1095551.1 hypothetical protein GYH30_040713 [Glycine max]
MSIIFRSDDVLIYSMAEVRRISNLFWAIFTLLGSLGLLFVAISSYLGMDLFFISEKISDFSFIPDFIYFPFIPTIKCSYNKIMISFIFFFLKKWVIKSRFFCVYACTKQTSYVVGCDPSQEGEDTVEKRRRMTALTCQHRDDEQQQEQ